MEATTPRRRLDGAMLVSLLGSGFLWLTLLLPPWTGALGLFLVGGAYVVLASVAMAAVYARDPVVLDHEVYILLALWLTAVGIWAALWLEGSLPLSSADQVVGALYAGLWLGSISFAMWQVLALILRGCHWRTRRPAPRPAP